MVRRTVTGEAPFAPTHMVGPWHEMGTPWGAHLPGLGQGAAFQLARLYDVSSGAPGPLQAVGSPSTVAWGRRLAQPRAFEWSMGCRVYRTEQGSGQVCCRLHATKWRWPPGGSLQYWGPHG